VNYTKFAPTTTMLSGQQPGNENYQVPLVCQWCWRYVICVFSRKDFFTIIDLPVGSHQYKFYVDGQWHCDDKEVNINCW